jgi:hypothetical protein
MNLLTIQHIYAIIYLIIINLEIDPIIKVKYTQCKFLVLKKSFTIKVSRRCRAILTYDLKALTTLWLDTVDIGKPINMSFLNFNFELLFKVTMPKM